MSKPQEDSYISVPDNLIKDLLTPSEVRMLKHRYSIIKLLESGLSIRAIAAQIGVGTDTVVRVARMIERKDVTGLVPKKIKTNTPWIFGKSE